MPITSEKHPFTSGNIHIAPQSAGVFGLYNARLTALFYASSGEFVGNIVGKTPVQPYFAGFSHAFTISLSGTVKTSPLLQAPFC